MKKLLTTPTTSYTGVGTDSLLALMQRLWDCEDGNLQADCQTDLRLTSMRRSRGSAKNFVQTNPPFPAVVFAVCERASGIIKFRVEATAAGKLPIEQAASLLAVHCLVSGKTISDYEVLVLLREDLLGLIAQRTQELLDVARSIRCDVRLSPREQEVLAGVRTLLSNKEIGARVNTSERNVKHTVTALFRKFKVRNRISLMYEACVLTDPDGYRFR